MKIKIWYILLAMSALVFISVVASAASNNLSTVPLEVYGLDSVAGNPVILRTSKTYSGAAVNFTLTQPTGKQLQFEGVAGADGVAYLKISDYYTRAVGIYGVSANVVGNPLPSRPNSFKILAGNLSMSNSELTPVNQVVHSGSEKANLSISLRDDFGNPVSGHIVRLVSSSGNDSIKYFNDKNISDENGQVKFLVSSDTASLVNYSLYDLTTDQVLPGRAKVVYFDSSAEVFNTRVKLAAFSSKDEGNSSGPIDHFQFEDLSANVNTSQGVTLRLTAFDAASQPVTNYAGTVRFTVDGGNGGFATLPGDYTYSVQDQGTHVFSLAFNFKQPGVYNLKAIDMANVAIFGTKTVTVAAGEAVEFGSGVKSGIIITNPLPGTFGANVQVISGTAPANSKLKIFDNKLEIGSTITDASGKFSYTTGLLADGDHKLYVASVNDIGTVIATSTTVDLKIDTKAAKVSQIVVDPSGSVDPGTLITVKIYTEDSLSKAQVVVAGNVYTLNKNVAGYYETSFPSPIDFGQYKLSFTFTDELGNETKSDDKTIQVGKIGQTGSALKTEKVTGLNVQPADGRVILSWAATTSLANPVKNYRVYFGLSPNQLSNAVDTFTNAPTWYIPNLKNGTEYYFAVAAVDMKGNISDGFDKIVSAKVGGVVTNVQPPNVQNGTAGKDQVKYMTADTSNTGPELLWLLIISMFGGAFYSLCSRKGV